MSSKPASHSRRWGPIIALGAALVFLTSCEYGEATGVSDLTDMSATLHGDVHSGDPTPRHWFEYDQNPTVVDGKLTFASSTYENEWSCCGPMLSAAMVVTGLSPDTTYYYRFCIRTDSGAGLCGGPDTFTTRPADRDSVEGSLAIPIMPELGYVDGVSASVRAEPDSSSPVGVASRIPGSYYFRIADRGEATCLRISGNRAAVGFVNAETPDTGDPPVSQIVFFEDNGSSGDRFGHLIVGETPASCPDPATAAVTWKVAIQGDVVITDHDPTV